MVIDTYANFADKDRCFQSTRVESKDQLDVLINAWNKQDENARFIFRGAVDAKYKLYNSAQRAWKGQELVKLGRSYNDFIQDEINNAKSLYNNLLQKYYNAFGHVAYDFSILSFLQHYGAPTPLLDWTYNFDCALFFGIDGLKHNPSTDIDNYFSIYVIDTSWHEFTSITDHLENAFEQIDSILLKYGEMNVDATESINNLEELKYSAFSGLTLFYLPGYTKGGISFGLSSRPDVKLYYNQHNLNIINQEGLFVFNASPDHPIEYFFTNSTEPNGTFNMPKIFCFDVHKSSDEYIIKYLNSIAPDPINKAFIYPQEEFIAKNSFTRFKNA